MYHFSSICRMEMDHFSSTHRVRYKQPHIIFIWVSFATLLHHLEILFLKLCVHYVWQWCNNLGAQEMITKLVLNTSIFMFLKFLNVTNLTSYRWFVDITPSQYWINPSLDFKVLNVTIFNILWLICKICLKA
jgi:hypothetical protein